MKRLLRLLAIVLVLTTCSSAIAETATQIWGAHSILPIANCTNAVIAKSTYNKKYGVLTPDGQMIIPFEYNDISAVSPGYYRAFPVVSANNALLLDINNSSLTPVPYHDFTIIDENWFVGIIVEPVSTKDGADYSIYTLGTSEREYFKIREYDVYYRPAGGKVGTLSRSEFDSAKAYGDHLLVESLAGTVQLYDSHLLPVSSSFTSLSASPYYITKDASGTKYITSRITEQKLITGFSGVGRTFLNNTLLWADTQVGTDLIDLNGRALLSDQEYIYTFVDDSRYIKVKKNSLLGLFDLEKQKLILPHEYTDILTPRPGMASCNGYFLVEKNGKVGYVDANNNVTCPIAYAKSVMTVLGCSMFAADLDGTYTLIAADGVITPLAGITEVHAYSGPENGRYIKVKNSDGLWGIMDWHGNLVVDYLSSSQYNFNFVDQTHFIYNDNAMYEIR